MAKANPFRFSTKYQDDETNLFYCGYDKPGLAEAINREPADVQHRLRAVKPEWEVEATRLASFDVQE